MEGAEGQSWQQSQGSHVLPRSSARVDGMGQLQQQGKLQ